MMPVLLVVLAVDLPPPAEPEPPPPPIKRETAAAGIVLSVLAAGLAAAIPATDTPQAGSSPAPVILGATGFFLVAFMRPIVFFSVTEKPTPARNVLRVLGSLTAVSGLISFIAGLAVRGGNPQASNWALVGAAGLEALSLGAFSADAMLAAK
jgi:hypothetical protein